MGRNQARICMSQLVHDLGHSGFAGSLWHQFSKSSGAAGIYASLSHFNQFGEDAFG